MIEVDLPEDAARTAYIACFQLAQAVNFEKSGKVAKTHKGVQAEFYLQTSSDVLVDRNLRKFLAEAYQYKYAADYATGMEEATSSAEAEQAVATASRFFAHFMKFLN